MHREALKQSATDPLSGKIDVSIITTGVSATARQRQIELTAALKKLVLPLGTSVTLTQQKLLADLKIATQLVRTFLSEVESTLKAGCQNLN